MLRLDKISKTYVVGTTVNALDEVSLSFRKNEFVSILGPSGSGKTTLLNIVGGLDKYTSGDLVIVGKSTKDFTDRDWDIYRNQRIGFIFQSYNLIPHQTILGNVELALTISGVPASERKQRALKALEEVGLKGQEHKKPNQLSGGQCQRVAIARALVNNPEILLADEPTGALDTATSEQIMKLIKKIANKKLVIMVTHNPDIAERYSTRIINLLDGKVIKDSNPFTEEEEVKEIKQLPQESINKQSKAKMNWFTAIALSTRNLLSKIKRTTLVSIAGSIGIIGVSTVLAVSNGITKYIESMQDDMLSSYPLTITEESVDYTSLMTGLSDTEKVKSISIQDGKIGIDSMIDYLMDKYTDFTSVKTNDINHDLISYINEMPKEAYAAISYNYGIDVTNNIFTTFKTNDESAERYVSLNGLTQMYIAELKTVEGFSEYAQFVDLFTNFMSLLPGDEEYIIGNRNGHSQYELVAGEFATEADELMIVINKDRTLTDITFAQLGFFNEEEFINLAKKSIEGNKDNPDDDLLSSYVFPDGFDVNDILNKELVYYPHNDIYSYKKVGTTSTELPGGTLYSYDLYGYSYDAYRSSAPANGYKMKIKGILQADENTNFGCLQSGVYYTEKFAEKYRTDSKNSDILTDEQHGFYSHIGHETNAPYLAYVTFPYTSYADPDNPIIKDDGFALCLNADLASSFSSLFSGMNGAIDYLEVDKIYLRALSGQSIKQISQPSGEGFKLITITDGDNNSYYDIDLLPNSISIYPESFDSKDIATDYLDNWNKEQAITLSNNKTLEFEDRDELTYSDPIELIINVINTLISIVTTALISFTSLALVVSCFMIAVITYISVVERVKEIGVIRSLGGRKKDVRHLFTAETFIIGFSSGIIGVGFTYLLCLILNAIVKGFDVPAIGRFNPIHAIIMVGLSFVLTVLSGLIPSGNASKQNPVDALRSE